MAVATTTTVTRDRAKKWQEVTLLMTGKKRRETTCKIRCQGYRQDERLYVDNANVEEMNEQR